MKNLKMWLILIFCTLTFSGCSYFQNNSHSQKPLIVKKDGIELKVGFSKNIYSADEDVIIKATIHNKRDELYIYRTSDSCDTGFRFNPNPTVQRLLDVRSAKVDGRDAFSGMCMTVMGSGSIQPNSKKVLEIILSPKKFINDRKLYKDEKLTSEVIFKETTLTFDIPIDLEKINSARNIPNSAEEGAEYFRNNENLQKWAKSKGFEMDKVIIREPRDYNDYWEISYFVPGDGAQYTMKYDGRKVPVANGYIQLKAESDTAKIIKAEYIVETYSDKNEVIIPHMVLRTQFANELKHNPNATYRISAHSNDFEKEIKKEISSDNREAKIKKHVSNIKKYNGKVVKQFESIYTYYADMKGKDILRMAQDKEWEYIMLAKE